MFDDTLLDDPVRLADADTSGWLRAVAMSGALVRSTAEVAAEHGLSEHVNVDRPRAFVLVGRHGVGRPVMGLIEAAVSASMPVVVTETVPSWVGALDVLYAHVDDPGDAELAESLERAARYGAAVVVNGPADGPVAAAIAGKGVQLTPRVAGGEHLFASALTGGLLTAAALKLVTFDAGAVADALDAEAERDHLAHESFVNPAKSLALRLADRTPLLWGLDPVATAVAVMAAHSLAAAAGVVADAADYRQAVRRGALHRAVVSGESSGDIFADPGESSGGLRLSLLAVRDDQASVVLKRSVSELFGHADLIDIGADDEIGPEAGGDGSVELVRAAVLALRFDIAATYLGLATGTIGGADRFTPVQA